MLKIRFSPKDSRVYDATVPLYVGEATGTAYYSLELRGQGKYPRLTFDTKEVIMPSVPLGFTSKATFYVISQGYDNLQLHVSIANHSAGKQPTTPIDVSCRNAVTH